MGHLMKMTGLSKRVGILVSATALTLGACQKAHSDKDAPADEGLNLSSLVWLMAGDLELAGDPKVYEIIVTPSAGGTPIRRAGDLPASGQTLRLDGLRADAAAVVTASLYKASIHPSQKTHSCAGDAPVALTAGATASLAMNCLPTVDPTAEPIKVFVKLAQLTLNVTIQSGADILAARDFTQPTLFAQIDKQGRRITLKQDAHALTVHVGGDVTYLKLNEAGADLPLIKLIQGETLQLQATAGQNLQSVPEDATLALNGSPLLYEPTPGHIAAVMPIKLENAAGTVGVDGRLFEEPAGSEITVVSYNVENLFDQTDEDRNQGYGDYRLTPNPSGKSSNYGEPAVLDGQTMTWTDVKVAGIRRALTGIDPAGPAIVGLVEVESKAAIDTLLANVQDLGYTTGVFTEWTPDMTPTAIGMGLISKLPILEWTMLRPATPAIPGAEASRPILKVTIDVQGSPLVVYINHWKSKGGPESQRILYAEALEADIRLLVAANPRADYVIMGDLNSEYNEKIIIEPEHNDAGGMTGINDILRAQGDELAVLRGTDPLLKYNLHYDLNKAARRTAWHEGHEWSALDHMIIGPGLYDQRGLTYIDGSFQPVTQLQPRLSFLFNPNGTTNRWKQQREGSNFTRHVVGGYSDHLPLVVRLRVPVRQSNGTIWLGTPGKPDLTDTVTP